jgi:uncharacterized protein (DUF1330 family)
MKGYIIADIRVTDPIRYEEYRRQVPPIIELFGGRYLVRGGEVTPLEGEFGLGRLVVLEFPSVAAARRFYDSDAYAPLKAIRQAASDSRLVLVAGYEEPRLA